VNVAIFGNSAIGVGNLVRVLRTVRYTAQLYTQRVVESLLLPVRYTATGNSKYMAIGTYKSDTCLSSTLNEW
jgi:hypothetical protein